MASHLEVEIKLRLLSEQDYVAALEFFQAYGTTKALRVPQFNNFYDGGLGELSSRKAVLRLRMDDRKGLVTIKEKVAGGGIHGGISTTKETEEEIPLSEAELILQSPNVFLDMSISRPIYTYLRETFHPSSVKSLGGFRMERSKVLWHELLLEIDRVHYSFGELYEIELETADPGRCKPLLEAALRGAGIRFLDSETTKFHRFIRGSLDG